MQAGQRAHAGNIRIMLQLGHQDDCMSPRSSLFFGKHLNSYRLLLVISTLYGIPHLLKHQILQIYQINNKFCKIVGLNYSYSQEKLKLLIFAFRIFYRGI